MSLLATILNGDALEAKRTGVPTAILILVDSDDEVTWHIYLTTSAEANSVVGKTGIAEGITFVMIDFARSTVGYFIMVTTSPMGDVVCTCDKRQSEGNESKD